MESLLLLPIALSFILIMVALPKWIRKCHHIGLLWEDMNKFNHPKNVAASGGIVVVFAFVFGVLAYIALRTFVFQIDSVNVKIFSLLNVVLILGMIGLTDDLLGWKHGGLSVNFRIIFAFLASIPLVVINAGTSAVNVPFFGLVDLGILYPLLIIPIGVAGATTTYNMLAGFNGLETGLGIIIISFLSYVAFITGNSWLSVIGLCMVAALCGFFIFNKVPAKVFPGDILTYSIGAMIAGMAILGNFEKIAVFVFIPFILETFLKSRGRLKKQSFGIPNEDNSLELPYPKLYGMTHVSLFILKKFKKKVYENDVVYFLFAFEIVLCVLALLIFRGGLV
ncbi:glycosyl transferase family 4 [Candidatus Pacearchaeota archaeon]|nr:glycosyl transferase family 4 [Candidatus Pacearchaeota archaeon]